MIQNDKVLLVILDGWGLGKIPVADAIYLADTPFFDGIMQDRPNATLVTFGNEVGLPDGQMGNSEVGHLNIGAGRTVFQDLLKIDNAIKDGELTKNQALLDAIAYAKSKDKPFHLLGLVSDGGVHSQLTHLKALCTILNDNGITSYIHAFTDGRDTSPIGGVNYLQELLNHIEKLETIQIASVCGRYYAMDRDKRWERTKIAYDLLTQGKGNKSTNLIDTITASYKADTTDEFIKPIVHTKADGTPVASIQEKDVVVCFNFRTDRCRQITRALHQENFEEHNMQKMDLYYVTMTEYDSNFENVHILFKDENLVNTLGEILAKNGKTQMRAAETEKYPHVTFFFNGGREEPFEGEERVLVNSPKVATYDLQPEMSAEELTESVIAHIESKQPNFAIINYANPDMVGHTGIKDAIVKAVETTDWCAERLVETALKHNYSCIIIADHGNADFIVNDDGSPHTAHTTNLVPIVFLDKNHPNAKIKNGKLGDIAPTILSILNLDIPKEMNGDVLLQA